VQYLPDINFLQTSLFMFKVNHKLITTTTSYKIFYQNNEIHDPSITIAPDHPKTIT